MAKKFICLIGYVDYAIEPEDALTLLAIEEHAKEVKRNDYRGPFITKPRSEGFIKSMRLEEVVDSPPLTEKPDATIIPQEDEEIPF